METDPVLRLKEIMADCCMIGFDGNDLLFLNQHASYVRCCGSDYGDSETFARLRDQATYVRRDKSGRYCPQVPPKVTPEQIIQAARAPPAACLRMSDDTTDEQLSDFIRGRRRT